MPHSSHIVDLAREIRPLLPELLGNNATSVDQELAHLLDRAKSGEDVDYEIRVLLGKHEATDIWKRNRLQANQQQNWDEKSISLPGKLTEAPDADEYACPEPGCAQSHWFPVDVGDVIPMCPTHNLRFEPVPNS